MALTAPFPTPGRVHGLSRAWRLAWCPLLAVLATTPAATSAAAATGDGWRAYDAGHYEDAVRAWTVEADAGSADAQFGLGVAYDLGRGVAPDARLACWYYAEAGEQGHVLAAFDTGVMQDSGACGERRADLAALWYGRAAAAGSGRAQFNLAQLYGSGDGVPRNPAGAAAWYRAAASNGIPAAAGRNSGPRQFSGGGRLRPASPVFPDPAHPLPFGGTATLVWTAPMQPGPVRFFVELYALQDSGPVEVAGEFVDVTATVVRLPPGATRFTWRVLTVGADPPQYAVGAWRDFQVSAGAGRPEGAGLAP